VAGRSARSNGDVGGRVLELSEREYFVRGRGYIGGVADLESRRRSAPTGAPRAGARRGDGALGGEIRRGAADLDGRGEAVSGIVVMRYGENALDVIGRVEAQARELRSTLPPGVEVVPVYDRAGLIERAIDTLRTRSPRR
jgi:Cu(I)/Ag(I) efflux system membrane protein CusA/SilA